MDTSCCDLEKKQQLSDERKLINRMIYPRARAGMSNSKATKTSEEATKVLKILHI